MLTFNLQIGQAWKITEKYIDFSAWFSPQKSNLIPFFAYIE